MASAITPSIRSVGTAVSGSGSITVSPGTHEAGDVQLLVVAYDNTSKAAPSGWFNLTQYNISDEYLSCYLRRCTSSSMSNATVSDTGDYNYGVIITIKDVQDFGDFIHKFEIGSKTSASTSFSCPSITTTKDKCLVINIVSRTNDSASASFSNWTNSNLSNLTEIFDGGTTTGDGGGIGMAVGELVTAGSSGQTTGSLSSSTTNCYITLAFSPYLQTTTSEWFYPTSASNVARNVGYTTEKPWSNISNVYSDNDSFATNSLVKAAVNQFGTYPSESDSIVASYGSINISGKIIGIEVEIKAKTSVANTIIGAHVVLGLSTVSTNFINIINNSTTLFRLGDVLMIDPYPATYIRDFYNVISMWGTTASYHYFSEFTEAVTNEILSSGNFKISASCSNINTSSDVTASIDTIRFRVRTEVGGWIPKIIGPF